MMLSKMNLTLKILGLLFIATTLYGVYNHYSSVPYMDMWDGYLDFYVKVTEGHWQSWFSQHNEHRTIFQNLLSYIDLKYFDGQSIFLTFCNISLMTSNALLLIVITKKLYGTNNNTDLENILILFSIILSFSWIQNENITWGYQSQFFAAYLFPLVSFYLLIQSKEKDNNFAFFLSVVFGIVSAGTMINGIIVLPILFLLSLFLGTNITKKAIIFISSIIVIYFYFKGYKTPSGHASINNTLIENPIAFFKYLFSYMGGIFYFVSLKTTTSLPQIGGLILLLSALFFTYLTVIKKSVNNYYFILLAFLLYYGGTAFGTAGGRSFFGIEQAYSSRYMTPSLIAWGLLFIFWSHYLKNNQKIINVILIIIFIITFGLFDFQRKALKDVYNYNFYKKVAILALEMEIRDETYIKNVFPFVDWIIQISKKPKAKNLSVFGNDKIKDIQNIIGNTIKAIPTNNLIGYVDKYTAIDNNSSSIGIKGWVFNDNLKITPQKLFVINEKREIIGYALIGEKRNDVKNTIHKEAYKSGYIGYIKKNMLFGKTFLVDENFNNKLEINISKRGLNNISLSILNSRIPHT